MIRFIYDLGPDPPALPDLNALFRKYKPEFNVKLDVAVSVDGEEYDVDEMVTDTVKKGIEKVGDTASAVDSSVGNNL